VLAFLSVFFPISFYPNIMLFYITYYISIRHLFSSFSIEGDNSFFPNIMLFYITYVIFIILDRRRFEMETLLHSSSKMDTSNIIFFDSYNEDFFFTIYKHPSLPPKVTAYETFLNPTATRCNPSTTSLL
jgi:hypothetical protein